MKNLAKIEFSIGLRSTPPAEPRPRCVPISRQAAERLFYVPPPRGETSSITPHALPPTYGEARLATLEKARFAPDDPDALLKKFNRDWSKSEPKGLQHPG